MLIYFLPAIILIGLLTSYEDIKKNKIRNKWIIAGLIYAFVVNLAFIFFFLVKAQVNWIYVLETLTNVVIALALSFAMWYFGLWTAGDAKLFTMYSFLLPINIYSNPIRFFPSAILLINVFVPAFIFYFFVILFKTNWKQKYKGIKEVLKPKQLLNSLISLFAIFWVIQILLKVIKIGNNYFFTMVLSIAVFYFIQKSFKKYFVAVAVFISLLRFFIDKSVYTFMFWKQFAGLFVFWILFRGFIAELGFLLLTTEVKIKELKKGMIPAEAIQKGKKEYKKEKLQTSFFPSPEKKKYLFESAAEGLTEKDVKKIKRLYKDKKLKFKTIKVQQTIPFAPFMFFGVLLTIIAKGNFLLLIRMFF